MDSAKLTAKLRKLSASQQAIEGLSEFCVRHRDEAKAIVKVWNAEYDDAPSDRKLACLYLANDILQNSRKGGREFVEEFVEVLPRAVRHLYRGNSDKVRKAVSRLVHIWDERKVLSGGAIKAMRDFFQHEPHVRSQAGKEGEEGSRKRMKFVEPLSKAVWDARQTSMKTAEWQANHQKAVEKGIQSEDPQALEMVRKQLGIYATALQSEITSRANCAEMLKNALQEQEHGIQRSKDILRMCLIQQKNVEQTIDSVKELEKHESPVLPPEMDSPLHPTMHYQGQQPLPDPEPLPPLPQPDQMPHVPQALQLPPAMQLPDPHQIPPQGHIAPPRPPMHPQQLAPPPVPHQLPHEMPPMQQGPPPPPPPPMYPVSQEFASMASMPHWNTEQPKPGTNFAGFDMGMVPHQMQANNGGWAPLTHQNGMDPCRDVANGLAASPQAATVLANALEAIPQDKQDEFGYAVADTLNHPQFGFNQPGSWGN
ncbi:hypothetical protein BSKO_02000 [Bryopsis sp. KO-2023]|nr:hypothetical protein BSKO_02000 [Bryopsis sp. KO-2023]